jgi:hypothetical protein
MGAENERLWREHCERCDRTKDGGQAFPVTDMNGGPASGGMSLRDYFAAAALQGLLANASEVNDELAAEAFMAADAMIAARERKEPKA